MPDVRHGRIVPELAVVYADKRLFFQAVSHLLERARLVADDGAAAVLDAHVGIKTVSKLDHVVPPVLFLIL